MMVDTHVHIWNLQRSAYNWLKLAPGLLNRDYDLDIIEEERKTAGIDAGVLVQADNSLEDTALMMEAAHTHEWIRGVVGWLPLLNPAETGRLINTVASKEKYFKGVRHLIHDEPDERWLLQDAVIESLKLLSAQGLPYDVVGVKTAHIETALSLAAKIPGLKLIFDHLNQPPIQAGEKFGHWGVLMKEAASHPNFYAKISGLGTTAGQGLFSTEAVKPYIDFILTTFGPKRCMLGGDWPVALLGGSYVTTWLVYRQAIEELVSDPQTRDSIFSKNAIAFYNLHL